MIDYCLFGVKVFSFVSICVSIGIFLKGMNERFLCPKMTLTPDSDVGVTNSPEKFPLRHTLGPSPSKSGTTCEEVD